MTLRKNRGENEQIFNISDYRPAAETPEITASLPEIDARNF